MESLGVVRDINHRGDLIVRSRCAHRPGTPVYDVRKKMIGNVLRTFGPVKEPYMLVSAKNVPDGEKLRLIKTELYIKSYKGSK